MFINMSGLQFPCLLFSYHWSFTTTYTTVLLVTHIYWVLTYFLSFISLLTSRFCCFFFHIKKWMVQTVTEWGNAIVTVFCKILWKNSFMSFYPIFCQLWISVVWTCLPCGSNFDSTFSPNLNVDYYCGDPWQRDEPKVILFLQCINFFSFLGCTQPD